MNEISFFENLRILSFRRPRGILCGVHGVFDCLYAVVEYFIQVDSFSTHD